MLSWIHKTAQIWQCLSLLGNIRLEEHAHRGTDVGKTHHRGRHHIPHRGTHHRGTCCVIRWKGCVPCEVTTNTQEKNSFSKEKKVTDKKLTLDKQRTASCKLSNGVIQTERDTWTHWRVSSKILDTLGTENIGTQTNVHEIFQTVTAASFI